MELYTEVSFCTNMHSVFEFTSYSLLEKELRGAVLTRTRMHLFLFLMGSYILLAITKGKGTAKQICHWNQAACKASEKRQGVLRCSPFTVGCRGWCRHTSIAGGLSASPKPATEKLELHCFCLALCDGFAPSRRTTLPPGKLMDIFLE